MPTTSIRSLIATWLFFLYPCLLHAHPTEQNTLIQRQVISNDIIPNFEAGKVTSLLLTLAPGARAGSHQHEGLIYAYVLKGNIRSQLGEGEVIEYREGQAWIEPPYMTHSLTENVSLSQSAQLLVVFVAQTGAKLTIPITK